MEACGGGVVVCGGGVVVCGGVWWVRAHCIKTVGHLQGVAFLISMKEDSLFLFIS